MMLLTLMYHEVINTEFTNDPDAFARHLHYLVANYPIVLPGEPLVKNKLNICLSFDDAYGDFYTHVFPLLKQYQVKAVLAIATDFISTEHTRYCSWQEINELAQSGLVQLASHSCSHQALHDKPSLWQKELQESQHIIQQQTGITPKTFVYPYGKFSKPLLQQTLKYYDYAMRIGSALNVNWHTNGLIYRADANLIWPQQKFLSSTQQVAMLFRLFLNKLRGK